MELLDHGNPFHEAPAAQFVCYISGSMEIFSFGMSISLATFTHQ